LEPQQLRALDAWAERQGEAASRPEAIRRLVELGLLATVTSPDLRYQAKASESANQAEKLARELGLKAKK
jgi:hypothetical protein